MTQCFVMNDGFNFLIVGGSFGENSLVINWHHFDELVQDGRPVFQQAVRHGGIRVLMMQFDQFQ